MIINKKSGKTSKRAFKSFVGFACKAVTHLFDLSNTSATAGYLKNTFLCLSIRTIGVFFVTLGVYSFVIAMILNLFTTRGADPTGIYGGLLCTVCSLPLLFSKGSVATSLVNSNVGSFLCHLLVVRKESLPCDVVLYNLSIAFVAGIAVSLFTLMFPFRVVMIALAVLAVILIILRSPEAGLTFFVLFLLLANVELQYLILCTTVFSYVLKLIRGKRSFFLKKTDFLLLAFALCSLGGMISSSQAAVPAVNMKYVYFLFPYLFAVCLMRDCRNIKNLMGFSVILGGSLCAVYLLGFAVNAVIPGDLAVDPAFLMRTVLKLPAFENGFAPLFCATLIPISVAFVMKPHSEGNRLTMFLCFVSMLCALIISESVAYTVAAVVSTVILVLIAGNRKLYFFLSVLLSATVITSFAGAFGEKLYGYIYSNIKEAYTKALGALLSENGAFVKQYLFCGHGFEENSVGNSFFYSIIYKFGFCGAFIITVLIIAVLCEAFSLVAHTYKNTSYRESFDRFKKIAEPAELRMGAVAMSCAVICVVICGTFSDLYNASSTYSWLFLVCGVCSSYATNAKSSVNKACSALLSDNSSERSCVTLKSSPGADKYSS